MLLLLPLTCAPRPPRRTTYMLGGMGRALEVTNSRVAFHGAWLLAAEQSQVLPCPLCLGTFGDGNQTLYVVVLTISLSYAMS